MKYVRKDTKSLNNKHLEKLGKSFLQFGKASYEFMSLIIYLILMALGIITVYVGYLVSLVVDKRNRIK